MKTPKQIQDDMDNPAIQGIKAAMKTNKELRMHERYQTILMHLHLVPNKEISSVTGRSLSTIYNYVNAYQKRGMEGLTIGTYTGRPRQLTSENEQQVYQVIVNKTPVDVGFPAKINRSLKS